MAIQQESKKFPQSYHVKLAVHNNDKVRIHTHTYTHTHTHTFTEMCPF
jgi:hypothetical protein